VGSTSHLQNHLLQTIRALASTFKIHINMFKLSLVIFHMNMTILLMILTCVKRNDICKRVSFEKK